MIEEVQQKMSRIFSFMPAPYQMYSCRGLGVRSHRAEHVFTKMNVKFLWPELWRLTKPPIHIANTKTFNSKRGEKGKRWWWLRMRTPVVDFGPIPQAPPVSTLITDLLRPQSWKQWKGIPSIYWIDFDKTGKGSWGDTLPTTHLDGPVFLTSSSWAKNSSKNKIDVNRQRKVIKFWLLAPDSNES